ncbi:hypothetical protein FOCC_FOCC006473 [Frankliniella occidentalis]|nr:hypothetical protein FOCC_FOCC006473 [Frankliniella occidentalis]
MSASEMFCFARNLEILDIVTAPVFERDSAVYFCTLIAQHHHIYQNVFNQRFKPKFHQPCTYFV